MTTCIEFGKYSSSLICASCCIIVHTNTPGDFDVPPTSQKWDTVHPAEVGCDESSEGTV